MTYTKLICRKISLIGIVIDLCEHLVRTSTMGQQLGTPQLWKPILAKMHPNHIAGLEQHLLSGLVHSSSIALAFLLNGLLCFHMYLPHIIYSF
jgi:hypothetical protein